MTFHIKFPIRLKLFILMAGFVLSATVMYLFLAVQVFRDDKTQLIYELNAATVKTLAAETEALLLRFVDKAKLLTQGYKDQSWVQSVFESDADLISFSLYRANRDSSEWAPISTVIN